jgi:hypothetical protein
MKRTAFASLFALALAAGAAHADSVVGGGGGATITGGGDNMTITYSTGGAGGSGSTLRSQPGRLARPTGTPSGTGVEYLEPAPSDPGREAWMVGGGDNAEVVYARPR